MLAIEFTLAAVVNIRYVLKHDDPSFWMNCLVLSIGLFALAFTLAYWAQIAGLASADEGLHSRRLIAQISTPVVWIVQTLLKPRAIEARSRRLAEQIANGVIKELPDA